MSLLPVIIAALLTVTPVTDTGTGTATEYEYEVPYVTEVETTETETDVVYIEPTEAVGCESTPTETEPLPEDMDERGYLQFVSMREIEMLAYLVDGEIGGGTYNEKCAVVWCVLNRMDKGSAAGFKDTVYGVLTQRLWSEKDQRYYYQFREYYGVGSKESTDIVIDCLTLWVMERQSGYPISGRVLPSDYCWYHGDGKHNHFRNAYKGGTEWDWSWTGGY